MDTKTATVKYTSDRKGPTASIAALDWHYTGNPGRGNMAVTIINANGDNRQFTSLNQAVLLGFITEAECVALCANFGWD